MGIVRVPKCIDGIRMTQSLWIAKMIGGLYKMEYIQDFAKKTTLDEHIDSVTKYAKRNSRPEMLRIPKRIQTAHCEKQNSIGGRECFCSHYLRNENDQYDLSCQECGHIHKIFQSYADLIALPCLLILVNKGQMGDTFPQSLIAMDNRSVNEKSDSYLVPFTQEKGRLCRYVSRDQDKLPYMYLGPRLYQQLENALKNDCSYFYSFIKNGKIDTKVKLTNNQLILSGQNHADADIDRTKRRDNHFLLRAEPQWCVLSTPFPIHFLVYLHFNLVSSVLAMFATRMVTEIIS